MPLDPRTWASMARPMTTPTPSQPPDAPGLLRVLGRWDLSSSVVNGVIGSGIFGLPATLALHLGFLSPLAFVLGGVGVFSVVLCFAEVASRFEDAGGPYLYVRESLGPLWGFQVGWLLFWTRILSAAAVLNVSVPYLAELVPAAGQPLGRALLMSVIVAVIATLNVIGVRQAAWTVNLFTLAKLLPLALLITLGLPRIAAGVLASQDVAVRDWTQAVLLTVFAYGGFESAVVPAGEAREPRRHMAFALIVAMLAVGFVYVSLQLVVVGVVPHVAAQGSAPVAAAFRVLFGAAGGLLAVVAVLLSVYGWTTAFALQTPRILYSMAQRGDMPLALARVHQRFRTPHVAVLLNAGLALSLALYGSFAATATIAAITRLVVYLLTCVALLVLRARNPEDAPGFQLPAGAAVAVAGIAFCVWLLATRTYAQIWVLLAILAAGLAARWLARVDRGKPARTMAQS
jgi:APA family basic amino acid/polyamine antiporter